MWVALYSPHGTYDAKFLANYAYINIIDPILRSPGIGNVQVFGAGQYAMRLWVKPDTLAKLGITVPEIVSAIQAQNTVNPAGKAGGEPAPKGQEYTYTVLSQGRLVSPEEFGNIVVRETPDGATVRVRDVARIELGRAGLQHRRTFQRQAGRHHCGVSIARIERSRRGGRGQEADGADERALSRGHGFRRFPRHDSFRDAGHQGNR